MEQEYQDKIKKLKRAVLEYLGSNGRHYGDLSRIEQSVEDLAQALNTKLDQLAMNLEDGSSPQEEESPRQRLANRFLETAAKLSQGGRVDRQIADEFESSLDLFDEAANLRRQSETLKDSAETAAIKHKRQRS